jgi:hypothetical protein
MKTQLKFVSALIVALGFHSAAFAATSDQIKADASNVNTACAPEAQASGCSDKTVDKGLLKCMGNYKKINKSFKFSPACKAAIKKLHSDKNAGK